MALFDFNGKISVIKRFIFFLFLQVGEIQGKRERGKKIETKSIKLRGGIS